MRDHQMATLAQKSDDLLEGKVDFICNPELSLKHPLENKWTLWYFKNDRTKEWEDNLREVMTFDTVEDFWSMYNHIERVSKLMAGCDYSFFKKGVKPMWEDEANKCGGRWLVNIDKRQRTSGDIDDMWLEVLLCLIGETFEDSGIMVNGAVVSIRPKADKICLWLRSSDPKESVMSIGRKMKESLKLHPSEMIQFENHSDTMHKASSHIKSKYIV